MSGSFFIDIFGAVAFIEIIFYRLKAGMRAFSHLCSVWRSMTARVILESVATSEISLCRLKAGMKAFGHL